MVRPIAALITAPVFTDNRLFPAADWSPVPDIVRIGFTFIDTVFLTRPVPLLLDRFGFDFNVLLVLHVVLSRLTAGLGTLAGG